MGAFLEQYGIAIFVLVIIGIMVALASPLGDLIEGILHNEITKFTSKPVSAYENK